MLCFFMKSRNWSGSFSRASFAKRAPLITSPGCPGYLRKGTNYHKNTEQASNNSTRSYQNVIVWEQYSKVVFTVGSMRQLTINFIKKMGFLMAKLETLPSLPHLKWSKSPLSVAVCASLEIETVTFQTCS